MYFVHKLKSKIKPLKPRHIMMYAKLTGEWRLAMLNQLLLCKSQEV